MNRRKGVCALFLVLGVAFLPPHAVKAAENAAGKWMEQEKENQADSAAIINEEDIVPAIKLTKKTLYVGGSSYKIAFVNLAADAVVKFSSSNKEIVTVTQKGTMKPVAAGTATVTAEIWQAEKFYTSQIPVTVKEPYVKITNTVKELTVGDTYKFEGKTYGLKNALTKWTVSNRSLAEIDSITGEFTALKAGKVKVTLKDTVSKKARSITVAIVEESEQSNEERAKWQAVKDEQTGYLMYQGLYYEIQKDKSAAVVDYYDLDITQLVIPDAVSYQGTAYPVVQVSQDVFSCLYDLTKVVIGNNVRVLEENAFSGCTALNEVVFGTGLQEIRGHAFEGCEALEEIVLPKGVETLGEEVFCSCTALKRITLPETLLVLGDNMFFDCVSLSQVSIPASVETIPYGLFTNCAALTKVELKKGLLVIEAEAFWACESLKKLELPEGLVFIGNRAFYNSALESITFPDKKVSIGEDIFDFCNRLTTICVFEGTAKYYEAAFGDWYDYEVVK